MAGAENIFAELVSLLNGIPSVRVELTTILPKFFGITLVIGRSKWVGPIVYCANGANIPVEVYSTAPSRQVKERSSSAYLRYRLSSKAIYGGRGAALDRFAIFGNFLVWHLHAIDALATKDANRLLALWDGKRVGHGHRALKTTKRNAKREGTSK